MTANERNYIRGTAAAMAAKGRHRRGQGAADCGPQTAVPRTEWIRHRTAWLAGLNPGNPRGENAMPH
jgi:hypothetical protein